MTDHRLPPLSEHRLPPRSSEDVVTGIEAEMRQEIGAALKRAERKLVDAIEACNSAEDDEAFAAARIAALEARHEYIVHRECVGLWGHAIIDELHPIPRPR